MGKRGPAPQPTAIRQRRGNPGHRHINRREPQPERGIPRPPVWLSARARTHWWEIGKELDRLGVLTMLDRDALALLCDDYAEIVGLRAYLRKNGWTYESRTRTDVLVRQRPEVRLLNEARKRYKSLLEQFGMTPAARTRVSAQESIGEAIDLTRPATAGLTGEQAVGDDAYLYGHLTVVKGGRE